MIKNRLVLYLISFAVIVASGSIAFAWTNPTANPPTGGGAISAGSGAPANAIRIIAGGNVGIGTTTPQARLDIFQSGAFNAITPGTVRYGIHLTPQNATANTAAGITFGAGDSGAGQTAQAGIYSQFSGAFGTRMYFATTNDYITGARTRMMIDANGNVGIGTTAPTTRLHVEGQVRITGGSPAAGRILTSLDTTGLATWETAPVDRSSDLVVSNWTTRADGGDNEWNAVTWSPERNLFVAVGQTGTNRVMTSPDGIVWTARADAADNLWRSVTWSPERGLFVAVSWSGTNRVMTSPDGITWTARADAGDNEWRSVRWSPERGLFVATAVTGTGNRVMTSPDGITWTARAVVDNTWEEVTWSPQLGLFVAVSGSGPSADQRVMTSPDGITWTMRTSVVGGWNSVAWSPERGLFVAVAEGGTYRVMTSPDGINWTARTATGAGDNMWNSVVWSSQLGLFVAVADDGINRVMTSPDGINWTPRITPVLEWKEIVWSPQLGVFVAVSDSGTDRVMTSLFLTP